MLYFLSFRPFLKSLFASLVVMALGVTASGSTQEKVDGDTIILGSAISFTGKYSTNGIHIKNGYDLAVKKVNELGGVKVGGKTYKLKIQYYDDESTPQRTARMLERLIVTDGIKYFLGPYPSSATAAAALIAEKYKVPMVSAESVSRTLFSKGYKYLFGVPSTSEQFLASSIALAAEIAEKNGLKTSDVNVAMAFEYDPFSLDVRTGVLEDMKKFGMKVVIDDKIPGDLNDISTTLAKVKTMKPDLLLLSGHSKGAAAGARLIKELNIDVPIVAMTHCEAANITINFGDAANGFLCPTQWSESLAYKDEWFGTAADYGKVFKATYDGYKNVPYQAAGASAVVLVWKEAFERANSFDTEKVRNAIAATDMQTFYGNVKFSKAGNNIAKPMILRQIQNGEYNVVAPTKWASHQVVLRPENKLNKLDFGIQLYNLRPLLQVHTADINQAHPAGIKKTVYNLVLDPLKQADPLVLKRGEKTTVRFWIGPLAEKNVLLPREIDERFKQLAEGQKTPITVRLECGVCEDEATQVDIIEFNPKEGISTLAQFTIVASEEKANDEPGLEYLALTLRMRGYELNRIKFPVFVENIDQNLLPYYNRPDVAFLELPNDLGAHPDLVISVTDESVKGDIAVIFEPYLPALYGELKDLVYLSGSKKWRKFKLERTEDKLKSLAENSYKNLRAMVHPDGKARARLIELYRNQGIKVFEPTFPSDAEKLIPDHLGNALNDFRRVGKDLYRNLFDGLGADTDSKKLRNIVRMLEEFASKYDRPLRIAIETPYFLPWQLLYPNIEENVTNEKADPEKFWGFKYELAVRQLIKNQHGRIDPTPLKLTPKDFIFARGQSQRKNDPIPDLADGLWKFLLIPFTGAEKPRSIDTRKLFIDTLRDEASELKVVFLFSHGSSGSHVLWDNDTQISIADDVGPHLIFEKNQKIIPINLERIADKVRDRPVWRHGPIFVLNACESGTGGADPANGGLFVTTLMELGARAVIVTESEVWAQFGAKWGKTLLGEMQEGNNLPKAVRNARRRHLMEDNNPMGLLYSLYGTHSARVQFP